MGSTAHELPVHQQDTKLTEEENNHPIEQVRLTVPTTDDPTLPALTFRTWVLGLASCAILAFLNQFFAFRQNSITISSVCAQIVVLPLGKLMAATLPARPLKVPFTNWSFSMNPGPFNLKEHGLITIFASAGYGGVYAVDIIIIVKAFYHRGINPIAAMLLANTTQLLGYGWAGLFRKYLVDSPYMWWPTNLVQVSLFRALHEEEKRPKGGQTRLQFFIIVLAASFAYYIIPAYLFPSIMSLSFVCWIWKDSITAQQIGSGLSGLGIGSFALDWSTISGFNSSPLASPAFAIFNTLAGFVLIMWVLTPIGYWTNSFNAKSFPIFSSGTFDSTGNHYNASRILNDTTFSLNIPEYNQYSKINLSIFFTYSYGLSFACLLATLTHVALFHGRVIATLIFVLVLWVQHSDAQEVTHPSTALGSILQLWRKTTSKADEDVHTRLMKKNYEQVPQWWFVAILVVVLALSIFTCEGFGKQLQLPYWGILLACVLAFVFTLPIGVITATTNQSPGLNVITEFIIGYLYPGKPLANVTFKTYGYISMAQAVTFLQDFKLGHYMKIPPKSMFVAQLAGTIVSCFVCFGTSWWLLTSVENICDPSKLPEGSPWTCPSDAVFYSASIIWGVAGPLRMFGPLGLYNKINYFFIFGLLAPVPVWLLSRAFPDKKWIKLINMPVIIGATANMPPGRSVNMIMWIIVGVIFNFFIYRKYKGWWARHNYVLSAGLDAGVAFMAVIAYFTLQIKDINGINWWGASLDDHCPLAHCPTAPGIVVDGCPVF